MKRKRNKFFELLQDYFNEYLPITRGLSESTIISYKATFRLLMEYMYNVKAVTSDTITFAKLTQDCISGFLDWLENDRKCSVSTRNQRLSAITAFSIYAQSRDFEDACILRNNVALIPKKKGIKNTRNYFTVNELKILFELPDKNSSIGKRDFTLLTFMYASGMRAQEVCNMTVSDITFNSDKASIKVLGKGRKMRRIGIPAQASKNLSKYITYRKLSSKPERHVFSSQTHEQMTVSCIEEIYSKYVKRARNEHPDLFRESYSPHSMRHTTATHMLEAGVPLIVVKNFLGHVSLQTTQIYAEVTQETMNKQLKSWNEKWFMEEKKTEYYDEKKKIIPDFLR